MSIRRFASKKISQFIERKHIGLCGEVFIIGIGTYFVLVKLVGSLYPSSVLADAGNKYSNITLAILFLLATFAKVSAMIVKAFPYPDFKSTSLAETSLIWYQTNLQMEHLVEKTTQSSLDGLKMAGRHDFDVSVRMIGKIFSGYVCKTLDLDENSGCIYYSLYSLETEKRSLIYEMHYDYRRQNRMPAEIPLDGCEYESYECVNCIRENNHTCYAVDTKIFHAPNSTKEYERFGQFMGSCLRNNNEVVGFLNVEFHGSKPFIDLGEMQDFMENHVFPFKQMLEYQYLRREFQTKLLS